MQRAITNVFYAGELRESFVPRHVHCSTVMSLMMERDNVPFSIARDYCFFPPVNIKKNFFYFFFFPFFQSFRCFNFLLRKYYMRVHFFPRIVNSDPIRYITIPRRRRQLLLHQLYHATFQLFHRSDSHFKQSRMPTIIQNCRIF